MPRKPNRSRQFMQVMAAFAARPSEWVHGYDLLKATGIQSGTLYPLLIRLHRQGLLEARWILSDEPDRRPRHAYRPTALGVLAAAGSTQASEEPPHFAAVPST